jgi:choline dehydrogenase-like flavoprotein
MYRRRIIQGAAVATPIIASTSLYYWRRNQRQHPSIIICGGGTGGCITAYYLAKWMDDNALPGKVVLLEGGKSYFSKDGPDPSMSQWFNNWGMYSKLHDTKAINDSYYPSPVSSHSGMGGAGAHDTRISFVPTEQQRLRYATTMNWSSTEMNMYLQTVLNLIPLQSAGENEIFYDAILDTLHSKRILTSTPEYKGNIIPNSMGYVSLAMYPDETRWTSAYLLHDKVRPKNLTVEAGVMVHRVVFKTDGKEEVRAIGVEIEQNGTKRLIKGDGVVITAGAIGTPAILQRSGIGPIKVLEELGIPVVVANDEVGHGVDHMEVPVVYKWNNKYRQPPHNELPRGGPMGWPVALFPMLDQDSTFFMAHLGISPPPYGGGDVTATPNCPNPDSKEGIRVFIRSLNPNEPTTIVHEECTKDFDFLHKALRKTITIFDVLQQSGVVGPRVEPPLSLDLNDKRAVKKWMSTHIATVYHWMSTCKAGIDPKTTVANEKFLVRRGSGVISNLWIGSGAVLPEITEANPHITISAFSIALAHEILKTMHEDITPLDLLRARNDYLSCDFFDDPKLQIRRVTQVRPDLWPIAEEHKKFHQKQ